VTEPRPARRGAVRHPLFARLFDRLSPFMEREVAHHRDELLAGLGGRVLELGAGNGLNFPHYPSTVSQVLAVEPEPLLRAEAVKNAANAPVPVEVVDGVSGRLPAERESFDVGVASLVLCSVPDQARALAEFRRVLRPGGELRFYEHVVAQRPVVAGLQRVADLTFWPRLVGGCHLSRDTASAIEAAGFSIESCERFVFTPGGPVPPIPHVLGVARRP
jgi:SAM-dependent methyltransferase